MVFVWSINFVVAKYALREFPPLVLGALRFSVAGVLIAPVYVWRQRKLDRPLWAGEESWKLLALGLLGIGLNQLIFLYGLVRTSVAHAAFLIALTPMMVLLLSSWIGHERITPGKLVGLGTAVAGVGVLQGRALLGGHGSSLGDLCVIGASITFALFTVFSKSLRGQFDSLTSTTFAFAGSSVALAPVTLWLLAISSLEAVSVNGWLSVLFMAIFPSLVAYLIFHHALKYLAPSRVSMLAYLQPILATAFGVVLLGEHVTASLVTAGALVLAGVLVAERAG
jgi:drug/metabolite transporter (DMT)-like permease